MGYMKGIRRGRSPKSFLAYSKNKSAFSKMPIICRDDLPGYGIDSWSVLLKRDTIKMRICRICYGIVSIHTRTIGAKNHDIACPGLNAFAEMDTDPLRDPIQYCRRFRFISNRRSMGQHFLGPEKRECIFVSNPRALLGPKRYENHQATFP